MEIWRTDGVTVNLVATSNPGPADAVDGLLGGVVGRLVTFRPPTGSWQRSSGRARVEHRATGTDIRRRCGNSDPFSSRPPARTCFSTRTTTDGRELWGDQDGPHSPEVNLPDSTDPADADRSPAFSSDRALL